MTNTQGSLNTLWATLLVRSLVDGGVRHFCVSPGYRNAPLTLALARHPKVNTFVHVDERGMAFHALGLAKAEEKPVALVVTSGTATSHLLPAIMEASADHIPLIILTADRPPELRKTGANQTTDQVGIYHHFVRYQVDLPCPTSSIPPRFIEKETAHALFHAKHPIPGPVHLNCMFRKPFFSKDPPLIPPPNHMTPHFGDSALSKETVNALSKRLQGIERGVILVGQLPPSSQVAPLIALAEKLRWPILPDLLTPIRLKGAHPLVLDTYELMLPPITDNPLFTPQAVLHFGSRFVSQNLLDWVTKSAPSPYLHITPHLSRYDPNHLITDHITSEIKPFCEALSDALPIHQSPTSWLTRWQELSEETFHLTAHTLSRETRLSQPTFWHQLTHHINPKLPLFIANSTPIRYANALYHIRTESGFLFGNRGLSGIDGNIATAIGIAKGLSSPLIALLGDLACFHDMNSLSQLREVSFPITWIVINNGGSAIFSELPIASQVDVFERFFKTPHHLSFKDLASLFKLDYYQVKELSALHSSIQNSPSSHTLIELVVDTKNELEVMRTLKRRLAKCEQVPLRTSPHFSQPSGKAWNI